MAKTTAELDLALESVRSMDLRYPDEELLECFLRESIDPAQAARYMLQRCSVGGQGLDLDLESFVSDWKHLINTFIYQGPIHQLQDKAVVAKIMERDRGRCFITGLGNSFWDPLVVVPILPPRKTHIDEKLHEIFGAFVGPDLRDWVLSGAAPSDPYRNHWLVRKSAAAALLKGFFQFDMGKGPLKTPGIRFVKQPPSGADSPDAFALQLLSQFANPIRWTLVSREIASKRPQRVSSPPPASRWRCFSEWGAAALLMVWRLVPASIRIRTYRGLMFLGTHMYGPSGSLRVQRLPFGMYVKFTRPNFYEKLANEYATIQLVRRHTGIPVPRALDLVSNSEKSYLVTSSVSGMRLGECIGTLSHEEEATLVCELQKSLAELRAIPKTLAPEYAITNSLGEACYDGRIITGSDPRSDGRECFGPFINEEQFNDTLRVGALPHVSHRSGHQIVFTHGDLNMRNILMRNGRLSGIVDWEMSGWYPEYWDYTKAHYATKLCRRWLKITDKVFERFGDFAAELSIEYQIWDYCF